MRMICRNALMASVLLIAGGCATTSSRDLTEDTNDKVNKLVQDLGPAVDNLNKTSAELTAKMESTDQNTRRLQTQMEEMQAQMDKVNREVSSVKKVVYQQNNLTMPGSGSGVVVEPPAGATPGETAATPAPAPAGDADGAALESISAPAPTQTAAAPAPAPAPAAADAGNPKELYQQAQQRYAQDDFSTAIKLFDDFLGKFPGDESAANAQFWKAKSQLRLGQYEDSIQAFNKVQQAYPTSTKVPFALHNAAVAYNKLGRNDDAAKLLQQVIDKYPLSPAADQARQDLKKLQGQ